MSSCRITPYMRRMNMNMNMNEYERHNETNIYVIPRDEKRGAWEHTTYLSWVRRALPGRTPYMGICKRERRWVSKTMADSKRGYSGFSNTDFWKELRPSWPCSITTYTGICERRRGGGGFQEPHPTRTRQNKELHEVHLYTSCKITTFRNHKPLELTGFLFFILRLLRPSEKNLRFALLRKEWPTR